MREIKFRFWDKEFKKWSNVPCGYRIEDINYYTDYEICQYTGMKDFSGKDIYEGDVFIKVCNYFDFEKKETYTKEIPCKVIFYNGSFKVYEHGCKKYDIEDVLLNKKEGNDYWKDFNIAGNIYEDENFRYLK